jgi:hypothetical protein
MSLFAMVRTVVRGLFQSSRVAIKSHKGAEVRVIRLRQGYGATSPRMPCLR